jgi:hypothetical protein
MLGRAHRRPLDRPQPTPHSQPLHTPADRSDTTPNTAAENLSAKGRICRRPAGGDLVRQDQPQHQGASQRHWWFLQRSQAWLRRPGPRARAADTCPGSVGGQRAGTQVCRRSRRGADSAGTSRRNSADSVARWACSAPSGPEGAEFRGNGPGNDVRTQLLPSLRSEVGTGGSGLGRPAQPGSPAADRPADRRSRSSGGRWPPGAR